MKVGLNVLFLGEGAGGVGRYAVELAGALAAREDVELELFTSRTEPAGLRSEPWASEARFTQLPVSPAGRAGYLAANFFALPALASARRFDVLHSPANVGPFLAPGVATLITVHDLIWMRFGEDWDSPEAVASMKRATSATVPRAKRVVTDSAASENDLVEKLGLDPGKIDVVPLGVRADPDAPFTPEAELRERFGLGSSRVILCVAQKRPYKGQDRLVRALAGLEGDAVLVLPGAPTGFELELRALADELGVASRVVFPDWVSEADLEGLYRMATCFALASEIEGFGLPVLEAMARGLPVACSDRSSLPEVSSGAAVLFDPDDRQATIDALSSLLEDERLRARLAVAGRERAAQFTWDRTARLTVDAYRQASDGA